MNKSKGIGCLVGITAMFAAVILSNGLFTVHETKQVLITQFGNVVGEPITTAGLKFKTPFIQKVKEFEKRILEWDGDAKEMPTKGKELITVDTYGRWKIVDLRKFYENLRDERSARSRLDDILGSETRNTIARHELIEMIRTTKDRVPAMSDELLEVTATNKVGTLPPISRGRILLEKEILENSQDKLADFGIQLLDIRFKRINYNQIVQENIYQRMISEREQIAELFRSEGAGEAAKVLGNMQKDLKEIDSTAYKQVETIKGEADGKAIEIYAKAYNQSPESIEFYEFQRTMNLYEEILAKDGTLILSTASDVFKYLKRIDPDDVPRESVLPPAGVPSPGGH